MNKSIILLSGGLDSLVCLGLGREKFNIGLAITFDYGQKSAISEINAARALCKYYDVEHLVIKLDWLKQITNNALVLDNINLPEGISNEKNAVKNVWVPNRNSLFLNIAAAYAEAQKYNYILIGANKEEAETFPDNSKQFIENINKTFEYSTLEKVVVLAPLLNYNKNDIVNLALSKSMPLELVHSCYDSYIKNCGTCESCTRLKNALIANGDTYYLKKLFEANDDNKIY